MAIEHRALFALSIAFTASIVAYPDFPPGTPRVRNVFTGRLLVAFLLPITAAVVWWVLARLHRAANGHSAQSHVDAERVGPATVLFLSAFHVIMLLALMGAQLWPGRILGLVVGAFLITTGNELPRLRQNAASRQLSRGVHRVRGYVRVVMGLAVCVTSMAGMRGAAELIVIAVCFETVLGVGAAVFLSRPKSALTGVLLLCCIPPAEAQEISPEKIAGLPAFIDATVPTLMARHHVVGTAVAVVHQGRVMFLRGYGKARLDGGVNVDPARTVFRIGSLTKVFTAAAAVQLAETGRLDLHRDVREFLPDIPLRYGATTHQLLTHTAGIDERFAGAYTDSPEHLQRLSNHLRRYIPEQVFSPGTASSYTNYGYAMVGLVVERLSGLPFEQYMAERIFKPLCMTSTSARQPPEGNLAKDLAQGYRWIGGGHEALPYTYTQGAPAGSMTTTAADMGRFMLAMLGDGSVDGERILLPKSLTTMLTSQYTPDPRIPGTAYGFGHLISHGQRLLVRGGTLGDQASLMVLVPAHKLGIVVASNALPGIGDFLFAPLMTHLAGPPVPAPAPTPLSDAVRRAPRFAGTYRNYRQTRNEMSRIRGLMPMMQPRVIAEPDGAIRWQGRRWLEIEPLVFQSVNSSDYIVFRENAGGEITGVGSYERIGWSEQTPFHLGILAVCVIAFLAYPLSTGLRAIRRRSALHEGGVAHTCAAFVAVTNLTFVVGLVVFFREFGRITPLPLPIVLWLSLPLASVAVTALLPGFAAIAWKEQWWTRGQRLGYSTFVVCAVAFMTFLNYWKLLGIRY